MTTILVGDHALSDRLLENIFRGSCDRYGSDDAIGVAGHGCHPHHSWRQFGLQWGGCQFSH